MILLSYPRSGSTWLRYCIEYLTGRPTVGQEPTGEQGGASFDTPLIHKGRTDYIVKKRHAILPTTEKEPLILLLRNYKECIVRHNINNGISLETLKGSAKGKAIKTPKKVDYISNLIEYNQWENEGHLIYYEHLMTTPGRVLGSLMYFMNNYTANVDKFIDEIDKHKKICLELYGKSVTKGKMLSYHVNRIDNPKEWDNYLWDNFPKIYNNYLTHYAD